MGCFNSKPLPQSDLVTDQKPGTILGKPLEDFNKLYTMGNELGKGGFGVTYMCEEKLTGHSYAVKSIPKRKLITEDDKKAVNTEIEILKDFSGVSNIVQIKDSHEDKNFVYIVMELCCGGELFDKIEALVKSDDYYSERDAAEIFKSIVNAVQICHSVDVVHRDLKPENFLFSSEDKANAKLKAIDFGCSVYIKEGTELKDIVRSEYYVAPELLEGKRYGKEIDIWSAGAMFLLLSGAPPFGNGKSLKS